MSVTLAATRVSTGALPVISMSGLSSSNSGDRQAVGAALRAACLDKGFFYVTDHGIPAGLIDAVLLETERFFAQAAECKAKIDKAHSFCNRGYEPLGAQTLEAGAPPDLKESFYIGAELPLDDPRVAGRRFNRGPNQWPADMPASGRRCGPISPPCWTSASASCKALPCRSTYPKTILRRLIAIPGRRCVYCTTRRSPAMPRPARKAQAPIPISGA